MNTLPPNNIIKLIATASGNVLYFFGAQHTNNPDDDQFVKIKQTWDEFIEVTGSRKIIFVEGNTRELPEDYDESIKMYGETGAVYWLAKQANLEVVRLEPDDEYHRTSLCELFDPNLVAYTIIVQNLAGWFRHITETSFKEAITRVINRESKFSNIYGFIPTESWFEEKHREIFDGQNLEDKDFLNKITDPNRSDTVINKVVSARSELRNQYIFSKITEAWDSGKSIFIIYGKGHLSALESSLRELVSR